MAEKEATVYIVDVGRSMGEHHHGRSVTDLEWAMQYVWDKITTTVRVFLSLSKAIITDRISGWNWSKNCDAFSSCFALRW